MRIVFTVRCPKCNNILDSQIVLNNAIVEFIDNEVVGFSYECPHCKNKIFFQTADSYEFKGRKFFEFKRGEQ